MENVNSSRPSTTQAAAAFAQSVSLKIDSGGDLRTKTERVIEQFRAAPPPVAQGPTAVGRLSSSTMLALLREQSRS